MGIANLSSALAKLGRAKEHLDAMECEIGKFNADESDVARVTFRYENGWYVGYLNPIRMAPSRIALIVGDAMNNTRAALDHLVWQLVLREDEKPDNGTCFPICETCDEFVEKVKTPAQRGKRSSLRGIPIDGDAWTLIKEAQPYHCPQPKDDALVLLNELTNFDKHRTLLVQEAWPDQETLADTFRWESNGQPVEPLERKFTISPLSPELPTEIARYRFAPGTSPRVYMKSHLRIRPSVGDNESSPAPLTMLGAVWERVLNLLHEFKTLTRVQE